MERAKEMLRQGSIVTDVCFAVGFPQPGSFSTTFRRHVGVSPLAYRDAQLREREARRLIPACFLVMHGPDRTP